MELARRLVSTGAYFFAAARMQYFLLEIQAYPPLRSTNGRITGLGPGRCCGLA
jgi:hypothetical protein